MASKYKNNSLKYIICILIFFVLGTIIGIIGTKSLLESNHDSKDVPSSTGQIDITDSSEYQATIEKLHASVKDNIIYCI